LIVCPFNRPHNLERVLNHWKRQLVSVPLVLVASQLGDWAARAEQAGATVLLGPPSIGGAKNVGLEHARAVGAEWVTFIDDDNYFGPMYLREVQRNAVEGVDVITQGIAFVRFGEDLWLFSAPLTFCAGHCTSVRVAIAPAFPEVSLGEDVGWSRELGSARVLHLGPWHSVYDRTGDGHAYDAPFAEFMRAFGPARYIGAVGDDFVDLPRSTSRFPIQTVSDEEVFEALEKRFV
jgi:glycosyltransferase involved in cell wall biosynthesis